MMSEIENNEKESGISVVIDCSNGKMTVEGSNNGDKPDIHTFETNSFIDIRTIGPKQVFHLRIESNGSSEDGNIETRPKIVQDISSVDSQADSSDIETTKTDSGDGAVSLLIESLRKDPSSSGSSQIDNNGTKTQETKPSIEDVLSSITAEKIAREISEAVILKKDGIRILIALIEKGSMRRRNMFRTDVFISNIPRALKELDKFDLIYYEDNKKLIKPNFEKIAVSCPWLYSKEIQEIVAKSDFKLGKAIQYVLYLFCKHRDGLSQDVILNVTGISESGFYVVKKRMVEYDLIEVVSDEKNIFISPKFSVDQTRGNLAISQEQIPIQETVISVNTVEGFNREKLESFVNMIKRGPPAVRLQTLSSQFKAGISDGKITRLLDAINEKIEIEIVDIGTGETITSWDPKYFNSKKFKRVIFGNLEIRVKDSNLEEEDARTEDIKKQEVDSVLSTDPTEPEEVKEETEEQKRENVVKKIERMIATPNLGNSHKVVLSILLDNYLSNYSLKMEMSDLMENANKQKLREAQIRGCFGGLQALKFIKKPSDIIELNIEI